MEYTFHTSNYDVEQLVPEVGKALEKRLELASRQRLPGMWKATDSLSQRNGTQQMTRGRLRYRRFAGVVLIVLGLFMMIPGLMKPQELLLPLFAGFCGLVFGIESLWSTRKKPVKNTSAEPVEVSAERPAKKPSKKQEEAARTFLSGLANVEPAYVRFSEEGMALNEDTVIGYEQMEFFIETRSGYLLTWDRQATFLQKKDLQHGDEAEFRGFIEGRVTSA